LTEEDVKKLIASADHARDKAFISVLWESGARVSEIGNLLFKQVIFDKYGLILTVRGKTGSRKIRLILSTPYLANWMNSHPFRNDPEAPLWINTGCVNHNKPMRYAGISKILKFAFDKAGIKKRRNPHLFRHSRATYMANHLTEFQMNQYFGWIQGSDMPSTYVHMSGKEVDDAVLMMNGVKTDIKKEQSKLLPIICPRCDTINENSSRHCNKCGGILDLKYAMEIEEKQKEESKEQSKQDQMMQILLHDPEFVRMMVKKIKETGIRA
jgi:hypothetical protein